LHGDEAFIFADAGYRGTDKRAELQDVKADWHIAEQPGKIRAFKKHPRINKVKIDNVLRKVCAGEIDKKLIKSFVQNRNPITKTKGS